MYIPRLLQPKLKRLVKNFKIILVVGARQVGKSTLLTHCYPQLKHITFDAITDDYGVRNDPIRFLNNFLPPIILDEIQYCPELLSPLKRYADQASQNGQYLLTGSQNLSVLKKAAESLAGRVGIMQLDALSIDELTQTPQHLLQNYLVDPASLIKKFKGLFTAPPYTLYKMIWRGGMPGIINFKDDEVSDYFDAYFKTYIERDIRVLENIQRLSDFDRFVRLCAALTSQEINYSQLGREIGIARPTAMHWLDILKHTYQWHEIAAYHGNHIKRITKKSKGFYADTGMACFLLRISSPDALAAHPMLGHLFENFIVTNILKLANTEATPPYAYHWRSTSGAEVDLLLERDGKIYPIEIKCKSKLSKHDCSGIYAFREKNKHLTIMPAIIIFTGNHCYEVTNDIFAIPWNAQFIQA